MLHSPGGLISAGIVKQKRAESTVYYESQVAGKTHGIINVFEENFKVLLTNLLMLFMTCEALRFPKVPLRNERWSVTAHIWDILGDHTLLNSCEEVTWNFSAPSCPLVRYYCGQWRSCESATWAWAMASTKILQLPPPTHTTPSSKGHITPG